MSITVWRAAKIRTMNPNMPVATHVATQSGRILAFGDERCAEPWGGGTPNDQFAHCVLMPGFVEGHAHLMAGAIWQYLYLGYHKRIAPDGTVWEGLNNLEEALNRLRQQAKENPNAENIVGWGFDPIFLKEERLNRYHLDTVCTERPVVVVHSNFHLMTVNSAALRLVGYDGRPNIEGVDRLPDGTVSGELHELSAMFPIMRRTNLELRSMSRSEQAVKDFGKLGQRVGVTTSADLINDLEESDISNLLNVTAQEAFPMRIVPALNGIVRPARETATRAFEVRHKSTDKLRLGSVKLMCDGSIQGYTARVRWPGYLGGKSNGIWNMPPEQLREAVQVLHTAGVQMHIHANGDEAVQVVIDTFTDLFSVHPRGNMRHIVQHCQMADAHQLQRISDLGLGVNLFSNHIWYFGHQHKTLTIGAERAAHLNGCRTALDAGIELAIHSDAPVTPLDPLFTAWCAVNRLTENNEVLGARQRITVPEALRAITLGAAWSLRLEHEIGSIDIGKKADFVALEDDPYEVHPLDLNKIGVVATVLGERVYLN